MSLLRRDGEAGIAHAEWSQDPSRQHRAQWDALQSCDQKPKHVARETVVKPGAWLVDQRQRRETCEPLVWREWVVDLRAERFRMRVADRAGMKLAIGQTGTMGQQIAKGDRT